MEGEPIWSAHVDPKHMVPQLVVIAACAGAFFTFLIYNMGASLVAATLVGFGLALFVWLRGQVDVREGIYMKVFDDRLVWRTNYGKNDVNYTEIEKVLMTDRGMIIRLIDGRSLRAPLSGEYFYEGYAILHGMYPQKFREKPSKLRAKW